MTPATLETYDQRLAREALERRNRFAALRSRVEAIARALGDEWAVEHVPNPYYENADGELHLVKALAPPVRVEVSPAHDPAWLYFTLDRRPASFSPHDPPVPKAKIVRTKDDATIARELRRRVILPGIRVLEQIRTRQAADDAAEARTAENSRRVADAMGVPHTRPLGHRRHVKTLRECYTAADTFSPTGCRLTIDLDIDTAIRVIALLKGQ